MSAFWIDSSRIDAAFDEQDVAAKTTNKRARVDIRSGTGRMLPSYFPVNNVSTRLISIGLLALAACSGRQQATLAVPIESPEETTETVSNRTSPTALQRGLDAAHAGRYRASAGWFEESIHRQESVAEALQNRAIIREAQGRDEDAIEDALAAIDAGGGTSARMVLAGIQVRAYLFDAAIDDLRDIVGGTDDADASSLLAVALASTGNPEEALQVLRDASDRNPFDPATLNNLGIVSEQLGDFAGARDLYNRAVDSDPEHYPAWRNLGMVLIRLNEDDNARRALERYLALAPEGVSDRGVIGGRVARLRE
jgi:tetratricopeptide (TPR) repeat protein